MPTMKDVARLAGVSVATVSATISGRAFVSQGLQDRVNEAVRELGYRPNPIASNLKRGRSSLIGLIIPDITNPFYTEFVAHVQALAREDGLSVTLGISDMDRERELALVESMAAQRAEALVMCPSGGDAGWVERLKARAAPTPLVLADSAPSDAPVDTVALDNRTAGRMATEHLLSFGHTNVAVLAGPLDAASSVERLNGYADAMRAAGLPAWSGETYNGGYRIDEGYAASRAMLESNSPPTAVFVCNNMMLIGMMRAAASLGRNVPGDLSIVSVDDFPWASAFRPALTTVRQPIEQMATAAFDAVRARIAGKDEPPRRDVFEPELVVRGSCGPRTS